MSKASVRWNSSRGSTIIEFALGASLLVTMFAGTFQFGWSLMIYNNLMTAVANAAMLGSQMDYDQSSPSTFTDAVKNLAVYGDLNAGSTRSAPGITTDEISVTVSAVSGVPKYLSVSVNGYEIDTLFTSFTLSDKPRVTVAYMGKVLCSGC